MTTKVKCELATVYPICRRILGAVGWKRLASWFPAGAGPEFFPQLLADSNGKENMPPFLASLATLEWSCHQVSEVAVSCCAEHGFVVNPALELHRLPWQHLPLLFPGNRSAAPGQPAPESGEELILVWREPERRMVRVETAQPADLMALKAVLEYASLEEAAVVGAVPAGTIDGVVRHAVWKGLLISPPSRIQRDPALFCVAGPELVREYGAAQVFTLQWHITQECDLHCRHCYDRSRRTAVALDEGIRILDDLSIFCRTRFVQGQVSFSGGNPLLHPAFIDLYRAAAERGFMLAILGNPAAGAVLKELLAIRRPVYYQVSLEGLEEHNDFIRGAGHFRRTMEFLAVLRQLEVPSLVMLTLTKHNINQVLPLAERLRGHVDGFTFNRLALFGEGANLELPSQEDYWAFLQEYLTETTRNPVLGLKDNLLNSILHREGRELFGGCAGFGCGAAFNFVALLADGEVHACRKFPSLLGTITEQSLEEIYESAEAQRYRAGSSSCAGCPIRPICGGCPAVTSSVGRDMFTECDPFCCMEG